MNKIMLLILSLMFCSKAFSAELYHPEVFSSDSENTLVGKVSKWGKEVVFNYRRITNIYKFVNSKKEEIYKAAFIDGYIQCTKSISNEFDVKAYKLLQSAGWNFEPDYSFISDNNEVLYNFLEKLYSE